ncbi:hypothetical protein CCAX7_36380 [Capsulimonas corticalis]|uniref:Uncharacterized protein n=1 Tax=Capsulimonas corticalis TaxID=2219043 RepID=A0A402D6V1_9BACT|nr:hypothetical protein [Capsulimonas corticalis]BDI31587.1 hypothetical protein CCAX7_36380 [Capsulimonas corticalis]
MEYFLHQDSVNPLTNEDEGCGVAFFSIVDVSRQPVRFGPQEAELVKAIIAAYDRAMAEKHIRPLTLAWVHHGENPGPVYSKMERSLWYMPTFVRLEIPSVSRF